MATPIFFFCFGAVRGTGIICSCCAALPGTHVHLGNGRRFRGRRIRQQQTSEHKEDTHIQNEGEEPAKTEETGTTLGKPGFRRRGNYYNRRFRTQNKNAPKREDNEEVVSNKK